MTEMSRGFNFDDFDRQIDEALLENERVMEAKVRAIRRPGEIGAVACRPTLLDLPEPPEAA